MSRVAYVNREYTEYKKSYIHIEDRGYQFADGVYEVFAIIDSKIVDYDGHIKRLYRSLNELSISSPIQKKSYKFHINEIIKRNIIKDGLVYLQVTRGVASRDFKFPKNSKSSIVIIGKNTPSNYYHNNFNKGIKVKTTKDLRWKRVDIKSLNLLPPVLAKQYAADNDCEEAWLLDDDGYITEGSSSNAWIVKDKTVITRPVSSSILNGITRSTLIKSLSKAGYKFIERRFNINDIKDADEAFITSATQFVMPVIAVNNIKIGDGSVGEFAQIFKEIYFKHISLS
ncbi:MAG: D-amino-acid transaminase [Pelagibacteraceae bacterium TMED267]|nr:MAG: D-amino-acid transaminase [Pelagibacteraceae bacterium TMED267]